MVSIPERVLEALKPANTKNIIGFYHVSIPERVLEALKPSSRPLGRDGFSKFQSLKGF